MKTPASLYRWAIKVRTLRHDGKTVPLELRLQGTEGDPEDAYCAAMSVLKIASQYDIVRSGESWFFKLFVDELSYWCWRDHEISQLKTAVQHFTDELEEKGLLT